MTNLGVNINAGLDTRVAIDRNNSGQIEDGEVVQNWKELDRFDANKDNYLKEKELKGLYFYYGKKEGQELWIRSDKPYYEEPYEGWQGAVSVRGIDLENKKVDLEMKFHHV